MGLEDTYQMGLEDTHQSQAADAYMLHAHVTTCMCAYVLPGAYWFQYNMNRQMSLPFIVKTWQQTGLMCLHNL